MRQGYFLFLFAIAVCLVTGARATSFAVLLGGNGSQEVEGCQSVEIDDLTWDYVENKTNVFPVEVADDLTRARRQQYKVYQPGQPHYGNARIVAPCGKPMREWFLMRERLGAKAFQDVSIVVYFDDGTPSRLFTLKACYPLSISDCTVQADGTATEMLEVSIGGVAFQDLSNGRFRKRPELLYQAWDDTLRERVTEAYDNWEGGDVWSITERIPDSPLRVASPGHKSVGEITLRGALTDGRKALYGWINDTVNGKPWKRSFSVIEVPKQGNARKAAPNNFDSFVTGYRFPRLEAGATDSQLLEEVTIKPIRMELK